MKYLLILLTLIAGQVAFCQDAEKLSKKEKKALVKQAKMYKSNPVKLKALNAELEDLRTDLARAKQDLNNSQPAVNRFKCKSWRPGKSIGSSKNSNCGTKKIPETYGQIPVKRSRIVL